MPGLLETIFGGDGVGGEPGAPMRALYATPIAGEVAKTLTDFGKNPELFFGGSARGGLDLPALFSGDYRKQKAADMEAEREAQKALATARGVQAAEQIASLFSGLATDTAQGNVRKGLVAQGMDPEAIQPYANAAKAERHAARKAGKTSGLLEDVANIADINSAQQAGQTRFGSDMQLREIGAQGAETRRNQGNQFGLSSLLQQRRHASRMAEIGAQQQPAGAEGLLATKTAGERNGLRDLKALRVMMRKGQVPENIRPQAEAALKGKSGRLAYNVLTNLGYQGRTASPAQVMANPMYREAADRARAAEGARVALQDVERAAMTPDGAGIDPTLFSPASAALMPDSAAGQSLMLSTFGGENAERKQNLLSTSAKNLGDYVLRMTGKVSNVNELERLKTVAPTGNEASGLLFAAKVRAFDRALQREAEVAAKEAEMIGSGMTLGKWQIDALRGEYDEIVRQLTAELSAVEQDPAAQPEGPLTPAEQAELEKYRANR